MKPPILDAAELRGAGRELPLPVAVALADGSPLILRQVLRLLPGKRIAGIADLDGQTVFAKLFIAERGERHWQAEQRGVAALHEAGIPTPQLRIAARLPGGIHVVVSEYLADAVSLAEAWQRLADPAPGDAAALATLLPVIAMLARMHRAGLAQRDLHLGNFLRVGERLLVIDGDSVQGGGVALSPMAAAENLGLLLAQLPAAWDVAAEQLLAAYRAADGVAGVDLSLLQGRIAAARAWRVRDYLGKCVRDCSLFAVEQDAKRFVSVLREAGPRLAGLLADPDAAITAGTRLKSGNTCTVARVNAGDASFVVKRYNIKNLRHALSRLWRPSRAWHSWREGHRLQLLGIATPAPLALIEERLGPLRRRAWLINEHCPGTSLAQHFSPERIPGEGEAAAIVALFATLARERITHGDLKASNLLWHANRIWLIDLDACTQHRSEAAWRKAWQRDRARLLRNWPADSVLTAWLERSLPPV